MASPQDVPAEEAGFPQEQPVATPAAAAHADVLGVDLSEVEGHGKDGTITKADVVAAAESAPATEVEPAAAPPADDAHVEPGASLFSDPSKVAPPAEEATADPAALVAEQPRTALRLLYECARQPVQITRAELETMRNDGSLWEGVRENGIPFGPRINEFEQAISNLLIEVVDR